MNLLSCADATNSWSHPSKSGTAQTMAGPHHEHQGAPCSQDHSTPPPLPDMAAVPTVSI